MWRRNTPSWKTKSTNTKPASRRTKVVKLVVDKWFVDKGFGFDKVPTGEVVFIHACAVRGAEIFTIGTDAWVQVVHNDARAQERYRASKVLGTRRVERGERDKERASRVAQQVRRAAALTAQLAAQSEKKVSEVRSHPPGLHDEPAAAAPQPTCSLSLLSATVLFQTGQSFSSYSVKVAGRTTTVSHASSRSSRLVRQRR